MSQPKGWVQAPFTMACAATLVAVSLTLANRKTPQARVTSLPPVRFRIQFVEMPPDALARTAWIGDMNNAGQIVGMYSHPNGTSAFLYAPQRNAIRATDLNEVATIGLPVGAHLQAGFAINEWGVLVGSLKQANGDIHPFALDLRVDNPVVDLLPHLGSSLTDGAQINENGDIVVWTKNPPAAYLFNPGLYNGDPAIRASRNGVPHDWSEDMPQLLPAEISEGPLRLNNPFGQRSAQLAGVTADRVVFRYTTGKTPTLETFPNLRISDRSQLEGFNDEGTICGETFREIEFGQCERIPFRFSDAPELIAGAVNDPVSDFNADGDLITHEHLFHRNWGFVRISPMVTGTDVDLATWRDGVPRLVAMTNRDGEANAPVIAGFLWGGMGEEKPPLLPPLFVLIPEPNSAP